MIQQFEPFQQVFEILKILIEFCMTWHKFLFLMYIWIKPVHFFSILRQFFFIDSGRQFLQVLSSCHKILLCENDQDSPALLLTISYTRSLQCSGIVNLHCELAWKIYICLQNPQWESSTKHRFKMLRLGSSSFLYFHWDTLSILITNPAPHAATHRLRLL